MTLPSSSNRVGYAGTASAGDIYTAANHAKMPGGWLGYDSITSDAAYDDTEAAVTGLSVTVSVGANRLLKVTASFDFTQDKDGETTFSIGQDGTKLPGGALTIPGTTNQPRTHVSYFVLASPTSGSHTYAVIAKASAYHDGVIKGSPTGYILVEDLGPVPA